MSRSSPPPGRMAYVDAMRMVAAMLVMVQHVFEGRPGIVRSLIIPLAPGVAGVALFFFISGFVIPMAVRGGFRAREFLVRRLFRIYPLYGMVLLLLATLGRFGVVPKLAFIASSSAGAWAANILLVAEYVGVRPFLGVSWTLAVELVWYAAFAAATLLARDRAADLLDRFVPVAILALAGVSLLIGERVPIGRPTMVYAAVIGYQCYRFRSGEIGARRFARSVAVFAVVALASNYVAFGIFAHPNLTTMQAIGPWTLASVLFLVWTLAAPLRDWPVFNRGLLPALGAMSYSIYLLHPVGTALAYLYLPPLLQVPGAFILTLALSVCAYRLIERPGIAAGRALSRHAARPGGAATT